MTLQKIQIKNFKSIKEATLTLQPLNLLLGVNGAGKSNFVQFFQLVNQLYEKRLQTYVVSHGKADGFLHHGSQYSDSLSGGLTFKTNEDNLINTYQFKLIPSNNGNLVIDTEKYGYKKAKTWQLKKNSGLEESKVSESRE
ncbi:MAG: AAA family ATPase, partial [Chitinophagales bacterium]